jgi:short subunit dehydrogenase-like uncharacterized protein
MYREIDYTRLVHYSYSMEESCGKGSLLYLNFTPWRKVVATLQKTIPDQGTEPNRQAQARAPKEAETRTNHRTTQRHDNTGADT